jgi:hypothetical protein
MPNQRYEPEPMMYLLRKIQVEISHGKAISQASGEVGITIETY